MNTRLIQVWSQIALGRSNREIAKDLQLSEKTIKAIATRLFSELGVHNRTQAAIAWVAQSAKNPTTPETLPCSSTK